MTKGYDVSYSIDFKRNMYKGLYVAFEGIDGAGKTVQLEKVSDYLREQKMPFTVISEPRRTGPVGRLINEVLQKRAHLPPTAIQYLFSADRITHQHDIILPALARGEAVLSHRCFWSSVPYGLMDWMETNSSTDLGENLLVAQSILSMYYQHTVPDVTFYLDVPAETAMKRIKQMGTMPEYYEKKEKLERVRNGYLWMMEKFPDELVMINADQEVDVVTEDILNVVQKVITKKKTQAAKALSLKN
ncbi:MAG TPA: dTMP kinase [Patescibacteria group bacterium]|nr:dTMP kinase [Patescibacteria group bacterium]